MNKPSMITIRSSYARIGLWSLLIDLRIGALGGDCAKADSTRNCDSNRKPRQWPNDTVPGHLSFRRFNSAHVQNTKQNS
jgi:hypothetical protein